MTDIKTLLANAGVEIPEDKKADFDKDFIANYKTIVEVEKITSARDEFKTQLDTANGTISDLKKSNGNNEALQNTIKEHEATIEKMKTEAANTAKMTTVRDSLRTMGVADPDYIIFKQGGIEKFTFSDDGKPEKLDDVVKTYRDNAAMTHLFKEDSQYYNPAGGKPDKKNPFAKETFNLTEQGQMLKENPTLAKELAASAGITI